MLVLLFAFSLTKSNISQIRKKRAVLLLKINYQSFVLSREKKNRKISEYNNNHSNSFNDNDDAAFYVYTEIKDANRKHKTT